MSAVWERIGARTVAWSAAVAVALTGLVGVASPAAAAGDGSISGAVTDSSGATVQGVVVNVYTSAEGSISLLREDVTTGADGAYTVDGLDDGDYLLQFATPDQAGALRPEWWDDAEDMDDATVISIHDGTPVADIDPVLALIGDLAGTVTDDNGDPLADIEVIATAENVPGFPGAKGEATTDADGEYAIAGLPEGDYSVRFSTDSTDANVLPEWYDDATSATDATAVTVQANNPRTGVDAELATGGVLGGMLTGPGSLPAKGGEVKVFIAGDGLTWSEYTTVHADATGSWRVDRLTPGNYRVGFSAEFSGVTLDTYWSNTDDFAEATLIPVSATSPRLDLNVKLTSESPLPLEPGVPVIGGTARVGSILTVDPGEWAPGVAWEYRWMAESEPIDGATGPSLVIPPALVGKRISVEVTGWLTEYTPEPVLSAPTAAVAPLPLTAGTPSIAGVLAYGSTVSVKPGSWTAGTAFAYQWYANGVKIAGATKASFAIGAAQKGKQLSVTVTGSKLGYTTVAKASAKTAKVATAGTPKISGKAKVGKKLTAKPGAWTSGTKFSYQWYANGVAIKKATKSTLTLKSAQKGKKITVKVTGKKSGYATVAKTSKATAKVKK